MTLKAEGEARRGAGRPRCEETRRAILAAAYDLLVSDGLGSFSIERVAALAGVGRPTIYRWWKSKGDLAIECFREKVLPALEVRESACPATDLRAFLHHTIKLVGRAEGRILAGIVAEGQLDPETLLSLKRHYIEIRGQQAKAILKRGIERRLFRADLELDHVVAFMLGPVLHQLMFAYPLDAAFEDHAVDLLLHGIQVPAASETARPDAA